MTESKPYCELPAADQAVRALTPLPADTPRAACVRCGEPTEYPADTAVTAPLCPACAWLEAQRGACSG
ncbi:hypothetical protein ACFYNO_18175 [Kitasatospora sp. NPDC006697]|uniref:hypothetical protein n=1 Tax=Kitasatospora sp. NPDC006697 TaxID=3364020 RepID=UPI00369B1ED2